LKDLILGLDPGSRHTGYGVIAVHGDTLHHISHGVIHLKENWTMHERFVKKCITGSGAADKELVQMMIFKLLGIQPKELAFDATDALSLAVTHARMREVNLRIRRMNEVSP
jgi:Holliday junction resolvasome RuvABC endonuclease subunit